MMNDINIAKKFIANDENTSTVYLELNNAFNLIKPKEVKIAVAYLTPDGFRAIKYGLNNQSMHILLGERPFLFRRGPREFLESGVDAEHLGPTEAIKWGEFLEGNVPWILMNHEERKALLESEGEDAMEMRRSFPMNLWEKVRDLVQFLSRENVEMRRFLGDFAGKIEHGTVLEHGVASKVRLHAKVYIMRGDSSAYSLIGSSNLTKGGLEGNIEANLTTTDEMEITRIEKWFEQKWEQGQDCKEEYIRLLEESVLFGSRFTPWQVFLKSLFTAYDRFLGFGLSEEVSVRLAQFQGEGVVRAVDLLEKHWGCMVCDSVGLGKTFSGLGILAEYLNRKKTIGKALVVCPAQLENNWATSKLRGWGIPGETITMESLATLADLEEIEDVLERRRKERLLKELQSYDILLVDESHNFRNPGAKRYKALMEVIRGGEKPDKRVILLTATPINNSLWDLYHQLMLIARGDNSWYVGRGPVANLEGLFRQLEKIGGGTGLLDTMLLTMVRRTRYDIRKRQEGGEPVEVGGKQLVFPKHNIPEAITYSLMSVYGKIYKNVVNAIEKLNFAVYNLERYGIKDPQKEKELKEIEQKVKRNDSIIGIIKTTYLKRTESSVPALLSSLRAQASYLDLFINLLEDGYVLRPKDRDRLRITLGQNLTDDLVESLDVEDISSFAEKLQRIKKDEYDFEKLKEDIIHDRDTIRELISSLELLEGDSKFSNEPKVLELKKLLESLPEKDKHGIPTKVVIFTNYKDTAEHIFLSLGGPSREKRQQGYRWQSNIKRKQWISILTGSDDKKRRNEVLMRFAPLSFLREDEDITDPVLLERIEPYRHEGIDILIATDVLSEGQNLQDAQYLLNYDLHWNPVRMIQRGGRIDRLFSPHDEVFFYNIMPEKGLEDLLKLVSRLQKRVYAIDATIGLDASVLGEKIEARGVDDLMKIKQGGTAADQIYLEGEKKQDLDDALEQLQSYIDLVKKLGTEEARSVPDGIYSIKEGDSPGIFIMLKMPEDLGGQTFWRFYPAGSNKALNSAIEVVQKIASNPEENRAEFSHEDNPFRYLIEPLKKAIAEIGQEFKRSLTAHDPGELVRLVLNYPRLLCSA